ncbi:MAG: hypothetical protein AAGL97_12050 [Pseudomonadota bacterium]
MIRCFVVLFALLAACNAPVDSDPAGDGDAPMANIDPVTPEPFQEEFLTACMAKPEQAPAGFYGNDPITPKSFCECMFTTTMEGLTDDEKLAAAFYLLGQSGVDLSGREEFRGGDPTAAIGGSEGVGRAVRQCGA